MNILSPILRLLSFPLRIAFDLGGDAPDTRPIAASNEKAAQYAKQAADQELAFKMMTYEDLLPYVRNNLQQGQDVADMQQQIAQKQADIGFENNDYYKDNFRPVELQTIMDAANYGTEQDQEQQAQRAVGDIGAQFDAQRAATNSAMLDAGIDPSSGKVVSQNRAMDVTEALAKSNAATQARMTTKDKGIALRSGVANFGRNMPNTAATAMAGSVGAGSASVGSGNASVNTALNAGNFAASGYGAQQTAANTQIGANTSTFNAQMGAANLENNAAGGLGQLAGQLGSAWISRPIPSARGLKRPVRKVSGDEALSRVAKVGEGVEEWDYKPGVADGGRHVGPYAEDVNKVMGEDCAPEGKAIDAISMLGYQAAAIAELKKKVDRIARGMRRV